MKKLNFVKAFIFCFFVLFYCSCSSLSLFSDDKNDVIRDEDIKREEFVSLQEAISSLKSNDPWGKRGEERVRLANKLYAFYTKNNDSNEGMQCLYDAIGILEEYYKSNNDKEALKQILYFTKDIHNEKSRHYLSDDILLKEGDIYYFVMHDNKKALQSYEEIVENYDNSDKYQVAQARIEEIKAKEDKLKEESVGKQILKKFYVNKNMQESMQKPQETVAKKESLDSVDEKIYNYDLYRKRFKVVIDPGHGGEEGGATNGRGLVEKDVTLDIALRLEKILRQNTDFEVYLTRRSDVFVPLSARTNFANEKQADVFISIHNNASVSRTAYGIETYYLDNTNDRSSKKLAERENRSVEYEGGSLGDLQFILSDLIQNGKQEESIILANMVQEDMLAQLGKKGWIGIKNLGVKKAPFYVLVGAHMPCILVETMFIDNSQDAKKLEKEKFREDLAYSLYVSILRFHDERKK